METYYTVYKVTNKVNGKVYIGCHKTKDLNDNYMGSGKYLRYSQEKHGLENFEKEILFIFDNSEEMYKKEAELVNEEFIAEENTYNLKLGGKGGWPKMDKTVYINGRNAANKVIKEKYGVNNPGEILKNAAAASMRMKKMHEDGKFKYNNFEGKYHTEETKNKIGEKNKINQSGSKNSQYGTRWIYSIEEKISKKIKKDEPLPAGWKEGRKIKF